MVSQNIPPKNNVVTFRSGENSFRTANLGDLLGSGYLRSFAMRAAQIPTADSRPVADLLAGRTVYKTKDELSRAAPKVIEFLQHQLSIFRESHGLKPLSKRPSVNELTAALLDFKRRVPSFVLENDAGRDKKIRYHNTTGNLLDAMAAYGLLQANSESTGRKVEGKALDRALAKMESIDTVAGSKPKRRATISNTAVANPATGGTPTRREADNAVPQQPTTAHTAGGEVSSEPPTPPQPTPTSVPSKLWRLGRAIRNSILGPPKPQE